MTFPLRAASSPLLLVAASLGLGAALWLAACGPAVQLAEVAPEPPPMEGRPAPSAPSAAPAAPVTAAPSAAESESRRVAPPYPIPSTADAQAPVEPQAPDLPALAAALSAEKATELTLARLEPCLLPEDATALVSVRTASSALACAMGAGAPRCVQITNTLEAARRGLCGELAAGETPPQAAVPPSALARALAPLAYAGYLARPHGEPNAPLALALRSPDGEVHLLAHDGARWRAVTEPLATDDGGAAGITRLWAADQLGGTARLLVSALSSEGGSERGEQTTWLYVLCTEGDALRVCARKVIGRFVWALAPGERAKRPAGGRTLDARPHLEVALTPSLSSDGAELRLRLAKTTLPRKLRARFTLPAEECSALTQGQTTCGPWPELSALRTDAGTWRFDGQTLVRAD